MNSQLKLFMVVNVDWFFLSHRLPIALAAKKRGYDVTIFAIEEAGKGDVIRSMGFKFVALPTTRSSTNILSELRVLIHLFIHYLKQKPDVVHHVAMKPVAYGSIAARWAGVNSVINAFSGLGYMFINKDDNRLTHRFIQKMFVYGFKNKGTKFIFQNLHDLNVLKELNIIQDRQAHIIKGSGVDLQEFSYSEKNVGHTVKFVLPARMLWDKGVGEFVEAAKMLKPKYNEQVDFVLAGGVDNGNRAGIPQSELEMWNADSMVRWLGFQDNMVEVLQSADVVVLPSYREGLPKSLIEACAIGRPIVTTDVPGCNDVVEHNINGLLVEVRNASALAIAMERLIADPELRIRMGKAARAKAEMEFSIENVVNKTLELYE